MTSARTTSTTMTTTSSTDLVLIHSDAYSGWAFNAQHPTQGRRFAIARDMLQCAAAKSGLTVLEQDSDLLPERELLELVHEPAYVAEVLDDAMCSEWSSERRDLANLAHRFVGGTLLALDALRHGKTRTAVHLPGAKHHAQRDHSSGFCVFADFALAANLEASQGRRVAILDFDAHHGDGTENLTRSNSSVLTYSVHDRTIFPGSGHADEPERHVYNEPLPARSGDAELVRGVRRFVALAKDFEADVIFVAAGADGLDDDPLSSLTYSIDGVEAAAGEVRDAFPDTPLLMGGAGGYRPDDLTPHLWARVAIRLAQRSHALKGSRI